MTSDRTNPDDLSGHQQEMFPRHVGYGGKKAAEIVGISYRQLDYWARTDLVRPSVADATGSGSQRRYSYRYLFIPGTIGSITWLAQNDDGIGRIRHGLVAACAGDPGRLTYKRSRRGEAEIDRAAAHTLAHCGASYELLDFTPYGYDERQYASPGYNLPVGSLTRTPNGRYPEYHTSADNLEFVRPECLADTFARYVDILNLLENNKKYINLNPKGEPQLGRRGLYGMFGGRKEAQSLEMALLWVLNLSDGEHSLLDIAERAGLAFPVIQEAAGALFNAGLLQELAE